MSSTLARRLAAEFVGTSVFLLVGAGSAVGARQAGISDPGVSLLTAALANGLGLAVAVTATLDISGGSLNPAITMALYASGKLRGRDVVPYILAEVAGAVVGASVLVAAVPQSIGQAVNWGSPTLAADIGVGQGILLEFLLTLFLAVAVFYTAVSAEAPRVGGFGIGTAVMADVLLGGAFTGAAMNPARAMGPMMAGLWFPGYWYIYWIGPCAGAVLVGLLYRFIGEANSSRGAQINTPGAAD